MKPLAAPMDPARPGPKDAAKPALASAPGPQALGLPDDTPEDDAPALVGRMVAVLAKMTGGSANRHPCRPSKPRRTQHPSCRLRR